MPEREPESGIPRAARAMARSGRKEAFPPHASPQRRKGQVRSVASHSRPALRNGPGDPAGLSLP